MSHKSILPLDFKLVFKHRKWFFHRKYVYSDLFGMILFNSFNFFTIKLSFQTNWISQMSLLRIRFQFGQGSRPSFNFLRDFSFHKFTEIRIYTVYLVLL